MIFTVTGINDSAKGSVDKLGLFMRSVYDIEVVPLRYSPVKWYQTRNLHLVYSIAQDLLRECRSYPQPWHFVGHSFGCYLIAAMMNHTDKNFESVTFFDGALNNNWLFPLGRRFDRLVNVHNHYDFALLLAMMQPFHPWGGIGRTGYKGFDNRVTNLEMNFWHGRHRHNPFSTPTLLRRSADIVKDNVGE